MADASLALAEPILHDGASRTAQHSGKAYKAVALIIGLIGAGLYSCIFLKPSSSTAREKAAVVLQEQEKGWMSRWFDEKGFGFIKPVDGGEDLFCHTRSLLDGEGSVKTGDGVTFIKQYNDRKGKDEAGEVRVDPDAEPMPEGNSGGGGGGGGGGDEGGGEEDGKAGAGTMGRWNSERGFGFVHPDEGGEDLFCHLRSLVNGEGSVNENDHVSYVKKYNDRKGKYEAQEVQPDGGTPPPQPADEPGKGVATRWNSERGFGFIQPDTKEGEEQGEDLFCHVKSLLDGATTLTEGDVVTFMRHWDPRRQKHSAVQAKSTGERAPGWDDQGEEGGGEGDGEGGGEGEGEGEGGGEGGEGGEGVEDKMGDLKVDGE